MCARLVSQLIMTLHDRALGDIVVYSGNGLFVAAITAARSVRPAIS